MMTVVLPGQSHLHLSLSGFVFSSFWERKKAMDRWASAVAGWLLMMTSRHLALVNLVVTVKRPRHPSSSRTDSSFLTIRFSSREEAKKKNREDV